MLDKIKSGDSSRSILIAVVGGLLALICVIGGGIATVAGLIGGDCPWGTELVENKEGGVLFERYCQKETDQGSFVRHGLYEEWDSDGNKIREIEYEDGLKHGEEKEWYSNGQLKRRAEYQEDELHGTVRTWFEDTGNNKTETPYVEGQRHGEANFWFEDGALRAKAGYENDQLHGPVTGWYEPDNGSAPPKLVEATYDDGELTRDVVLHPIDDDHAKLEVTAKDGEITTPATIYYDGDELSSGESVLNTLESTEERLMFAVQIHECLEEIRPWAIDEADDLTDAPRCQAVTDVLFENSSQALLTIGEMMDRHDEMQ